MTEPNDEELIAWMRKVMGDECLAAARLEALRAERDAEKWRVDNWRKCFEQQQERAKKAEARAEKAEAENARLREALERARPLVEKWCHYQGNTQAMFDEYIGPIDAALAPVEAKGGDDGR